MLLYKNDCIGDGLHQAKNIVLAYYFYIKSCGFLTSKIPNFFKILSKQFFNDNLNLITTK